MKPSKPNKIHSLTLVLSRAPCQGHAKITPHRRCQGDPRQRESPALNATAKAQPAVQAKRCCEGLSFFRGKTEPAFVGDSPLAGNSKLVFKKLCGTIPKMDPKVAPPFWRLSPGILKPDSIFSVCQVRGFWTRGDWLRFASDSFKLEARHQLEGT